MTDEKATLDTIEIGELMQLLPHRYPFLLVDRIIDIDGDQSARGIKNVIDGISAVDYDGFVKLTTEHDKVQSWL